MPKAETNLDILVFYHIPETNKLGDFYTTWSST